MVAPRLRSRSVKKLSRKTPGGRQSVIYKSKKPAKATCAICHAKLNAVPNRKSSEMRKLSKTEKRPERLFGGVLCHNCVASVVKSKARMSSGALARTDVPLKLLKYIEMMK